jgi:hypothetical protein
MTTSIITWKVSAFISSPPAGSSKGGAAVAGVEHSKQRCWQVCADWRPGVFGVGACSCCV